MCPALDPVDRYAQLRSAGRVRERSLFPSQRTPPELEIQARWFAGEFGNQFVSIAGEKVEIIQFGTWNREAGPDFRDAAIRLNGSGPLRGCIEIDTTDRSWETHGHSTNPAFEETVLHVFVDQGERAFFTRTPANRNVPQVRIDLAALADKFSMNIPLARSGRCQAPLQEADDERVRAVLQGAAQFRLQKKAARLQGNCEIHGRDEALFQEIASALGYKENKLPFTLIAQRSTLKALRKNSNATEALLFGFAGFLETPDLAVYQSSTREYVRGLWENWWPRRDDSQRLILPAKLWRITGTRPANHPQRRLAALGVIASCWPEFLRAMEGHATTSLRKFFRALAHPYWNFHYTLTAQPSAKEMALVGTARVSEILANVILPFWLLEKADVWAEYTALPAQLTNHRLETAATRLFASNPRRAHFMKNLAHQQGLLQIYEDFCLQDDSDCAQCPFPEQMAKWT